MLPSEFKPGGSFAQDAPEFAFGNRGFAPQLAASFLVPFRACGPVAMSAQRSRPQAAENTVIDSQPEGPFGSVGAQTDDPAAVGYFNDATNRIRKAVMTDDHVAGAEVFDGG